MALVDAFVPEMGSKSESSGASSFLLLVRRRDVACFVLVVFADAFFTFDADADVDADG